MPLRHYLVGMKALAESTKELHFAKYGNHDHEPIIHISGVRLTLSSCIENQKANSQKDPQYKYIPKKRSKKKKKQRKTPCNVSLNMHIFLPERKEKL
ncbi:hypothetical protein AWENTII_002512 [Aspergillus wentii]